MTPGIVYALGAMLCFGIGDLIYKRGASAGAEPHHFLMTQSWVFTPTVILYALLTGSLHLTASAVLWGGLAGLFVLIGFYNFAYSLKSGDVSINAPVFRLSFVVTAVLAVLLLGEAVTAYKVIGIGLALVAVWLLLAAPSGTGRDARESRISLVRVVIATIAVGVGNLFYKYGLLAGATPGSLIAAQAGVVVTLVTLFVAFTDGNIHPSRAALRYAPWAAVVLATGFILMVESLALGDASVMVPVAQMGFCVTALVGLIFLREPFTARKGVGFAAALVALLSIARG
jgi:drug/metabolite transporter (DMT)-like permease